MEIGMNIDEPQSVPKPFQFQCTVCSKTFLRESSLKEHLLNKHVEKKEFQCIQCFETNQVVKSFALQSNLTSHIKRIHGPPRYKCPVCFKSFNDSSNFASHKRIHSQTNIKKHKCALCLKVFSLNKELQTHLFYTHKQRKKDVNYFRCELCSREFLRRSQLEHHVVNQHVVDKSFECPVCSKTFIDQETLDKHMKRHGDRKIKYFCDVCSQGFDSKKSLIQHLRVTHNHFCYCGKCKKSFKNKPDFDEHISDSKQNFKCYICQELMTSECILKIHTDSHVKEIKAEAKGDEVKPQIKPLETDTRFIPKSTQKLNSQNFECELCAETFDRKAYFKAHQRIFHPNAEWKCSFEGCSKTFKNYSNFISHKLVHANTKDFVCNICGKSFYRLDLLNKHEQVHLKEKKYTCEFCLKPKSFATTSSQKLKSHTANNHGVLKPFKCPFVNCGKLWANNYRLNRHLDSHQTEKLIKCEICQPFRAFKSCENLIKHQREVHSVRKTTKTVKSRDILKNKKVSDDAFIFICSENACFFKTDNEKDVALHYNEQHQLPQVLI